MQSRASGLTTVALRGSQPAFRHLALAGGALKHDRVVVLGRIVGMDLKHDGVRIRVFTRVDDMLVLLEAGLLSPRACGGAGGSRCLFQLFGVSGVHAFLGRFTE